MDPTGAMWLSVDPVFHAGTSPYAYCLGNPVKMIDPDGREATPEFEILLKQTKKFAAEKLKDPSISDKERREYESVFSEAGKLRKSNQTYHVEYKDLTTGVQTGDTKYNAYTIYDPSNDRVTVVMNNKAEDYDPLLNPFPKSEAGLADFAHEAKHCYQFEVGLHSFNEKGGVGHLYDYGDEVEAHYRGFVFGADKPDPEYSYKKFGLIPRGINVESIKKGSIMMIEENKNRFYFRHEGKTYKPNRTK